MVSLSWESGDDNGDRGANNVPERVCGELTIAGEVTLELVEREGDIVVPFISLEKEGCPRRPKEGSGVLGQPTFRFSCFLI
jgi:hypothetical protein